MISKEIRKNSLWYKEFRKMLFVILSIILGEFLVVGLFFGLLVAGFNYLNQESEYLFWVFLAVGGTILIVYQIFFLWVLRKGLRPIKDEISGIAPAKQNQQIDVFISILNEEVGFKINFFRFFKFSYWKYRLAIGAIADYGEESSLNILQDYVDNNPVKEFRKLAAHAIERSKSKTSSFELFSQQSEYKPGITAYDTRKYTSKFIMKLEKHSNSLWKMKEKQLIIFEKTSKFGFLYLLFSMIFLAAGIPLFIIFRLSTDYYEYLVLPILFGSFFLIIGIVTFIFENNQYKIVKELKERNDVPELLAILAKGVTEKKVRSTKIIFAISALADLGLEEIIDDLLVIARTSRSVQVINTAQAGIILLAMKAGYKDRNEFLTAKEKSYY